MRNALKIYDNSCMIDVSIPVSLSNLIKKLLEKNVDDRCHSIKGLHLKVSPLHQHSYQIIETMNSHPLKKKIKTTDETEGDKKLTVTNKEVDVADDEEKEESNEEKR